MDFHQGKPQAQSEPIAAASGRSERTAPASDVTAMATIASAGAEHAAGPTWRGRLVRGSLLASALTIAAVLGWTVASSDVSSTAWAAIWPSQASVPAQGSGQATGSPKIPSDLRAWQESMEAAQRESAARVDALVAQVDEIRNEIESSRGDLTGRLDQVVAKMAQVERAGQRSVLRRDPERQLEASIPSPPKPARAPGPPKPVAASEPKDRPAAASVAEGRTARNVPASTPAPVHDSSRPAEQDEGFMQRTGRWIVSSGRALIGLSN